ncbi:MAG TPA: hypothetical protein VE646_04840 [Actinomycetota bacterium]|nr:hypothetical protein [Actinomycetota bacterium]
MSWRPSLIARAVTGTVLGFALWLGLVVSTDLQELLAGVIACTAVAAVAPLLRSRPARTSLGWVHVVRPVLHSLPRLVPDTVALTVILWRRATRGAEPPSRFVAVRAPVGGHDARAVGRRVAATVGASLAPGAYVVHTTEDGWILLHQLRPASSTGIRGASQP